jgi:hypothetical protein
MLHPRDLCADCMVALVTVTGSHFDPFREEMIPGLLMEFGVASGDSIKHLARIHFGQPVYGFDSFCGLPEQWLDDDNDQRELKGAFACDPPMDLPPNVILIEGLFADTLPRFLAAHPVSNVALAHIDSDLYSSAKTVLDNIAPRCRPGTILAFDEIFGFRDYENQEAKAFCEFLDKTGFGYEFLGGQVHRAAFRLRG